MDTPLVKHDSCSQQSIGGSNSRSTSHSTFAELPVEILNIVLDNLQVLGGNSALASVAQTCRYLKDVAYPILWKDVYWDGRYLTGIQIPTQDQHAKNKTWTHIM